MAAVSQTTVGVSTPTDSTENSEARVPLLMPLPKLIPVVIVMVTLVVLAVGGNLLVIVSYYRDHQLRTVHNFYIVNLAVVDLMLGACSMCFYAYYTAAGRSWPFGPAWCKVFLVIDFTLSLQSVLLIIIISVDSLILVKTGLDYARKATWRFAYVQVTVSWTVAFLLYSPAIIGWDHWTGKSSVAPGDCDVEFADNFPFTIATGMAEFALPVVTLAVVNLLVYLEIRKRVRVSVARHEAVSRALTGSQEAEPTVGRASGRSQQTEAALRPEARRSLKAGKALAVLVAALAVTWAPYSISATAMAFCHDCFSHDLHEVFHWLLWAKSSINPFLYAYNSARFRKNFLHLLHACCHRCTHSTCGEACAGLKRRADNIAPTTSSVH